MTDREDMTDPEPRVQLARTKGGPVSVGHRGRAERIGEAMVDLRLVIDGFVAQPPSLFRDAVASLTRHCSIFLRKMALGDDRSPRLLNDETCRTAGLGFDRVRRIPGDRRTLTLVPVEIAGCYLQATKLDEETGDPEAAYVLPLGQQGLSIAVEWPLPGMADWLIQPTPRAPWNIRSEGLFGSESSPVLSCDRWLGQQLVLFDNLNRPGFSGDSVH